MASLKELKALLDKIGSLDKSVDPLAALDDADKVAIMCRDEELRDALVEFIEAAREYVRFAMPPSQVSSGSIDADQIVNYTLSSSQPIQYYPVIQPNTNAAISAALNKSFNEAKRRL